MTSLQQFLIMGGYAKYVWPAYLITLLILIVNIILPLIKQHRLLNRR